MAEKIVMWKANNGSLFSTEAEAEQENFVQEIANILDGASCSYDFNTEQGARELLKHFRLVKLDQQP